MGFLKTLFTNPLKAVRQTVDYTLDLVGDVLSWVIDIPEIPDFASQQRGFLVNKQANDQPIPVVYGERMIGGTRVFVETGGTDNKNLYICLALCEGPVESIGDVYIDDVISTDSKFSGLVTIDKNLGAFAQSSSSLLQEATSWTTSHRLQGVAYLGLKIVFDADVFRGIPTVTAKVKGKQVYDPRKDSTSSVYDSSLGVSTHRSNSWATWEWTDNPALCLRDYLTNDQYGKGIPDAEIDEQGIADGADFCDDTVTEYTGGSAQYIYRCNAILDTGQSIFNNTVQLLKGMRGLLPFSNGKYKLVIDDDPASSTFTFNEDNIVSDIDVSSTGRKERYNRCVAKFTNKDANWQPDEIAYPEKDSTEYATYKTEDNEIEQELQLDLPTITAVYQARDIARVAVLASRQQTLSVTFTADSSSIKVEVGDLVLLNYSSLGFTNKQFKCRSMSINLDGTCSFQLFEHDATAYPWEVLSEIDALSSPTFVNPADAPLPIPSSGSLLIQTDTDNDGADRRYIWYYFPATSYEYIDYYEVQLDEGNTGSYRTVARTTDTEYRLYNYVTGTQLSFRYRIVSIFNTKSSWNDSQITPTTRDEVTGLRITDESAPVGKLKPRSNFDYLGTSSNPKYKYFLGPSGSGTGFENSDYAIGGKSYQADEGGIVAYAEVGPAFTAFTESDAISNYSYAGNFFGGHNITANKSPARAQLAAFAEGGRFRVGNVNSVNVSNATSANPCVITTSTTHNLNSDDGVYFSAFTGVWAFLNGQSSPIVVLTDTTFSIDLDTSSVSTYSGNAGVIKSSRPLYVEDGVSADVILARVFEGSAYSIYTNVGTAGPFTASHDGLIEKEIYPELGDILIDVEVKAAPSINDAITSVAISSQANQAGVIGVFAGDLGGGFVPAALGEDSPFVWKNQVPSGGEWVLKAEHEHLFETYKTIKINSIGEGKINVCGQNGNISVGDLIVASDTQGKGMKQSDDIIRSYTVAKSRENVTFASADEVKQIACIYLGG